MLRWKGRSDRDDHENPDDVDRDGLGDESRHTMDSHPLLPLSVQYPAAASSSFRAPSASASSPPSSRWYWSRFRSLARRRAYRLGLVVSLCVVGLLNLHFLGTLRRDFIYLVRPLWDAPERPFTIIDHYPFPGPIPLSLPLPPPQIRSRPGRALGSSQDPSQRREEEDEGEAVSQWCALHGWAARPGGRPEMVDAVLVSSELDMLEIRMREYAPFVSTFVVVEANATFAGDPKPLYFADQRERFDRIAAAAGSGSKIVYRAVTDLVGNQPRGSFANEAAMRHAVSDVLSSLQLARGALVIQSDVDEIISRDTLRLLASCSGFPTELHLNVKNYRYAFAFPLPDDGYWRPRIHTVTATPAPAPAPATAAAAAAAATASDKAYAVPYYHGRGGDALLAGAGWHCTFCFRTLAEMAAKMRGYSHNDRLRSDDLADLRNLRRRVCRGQDPFNMFPEAWTFKDLVAQSGATKPSHTYLDLPIALAEDPQRFSYLLSGGCDRPDE